MAETIIRHKRLVCRIDELGDALHVVLAESAGELPLRLLCEQGGMVDTSQFSVSLLSTDHQEERSSVRIGVFFNEIIGGCNCHDDPHRANVYGVLSLRVDRRKGEALVVIVDD